MQRHNHHFDLNTTRQQRKAEHRLRWPVTRLVAIPAFPSLSGATSKAVRLRFTCFIFGQTFALKFRRTYPSPRDQNLKVASSNPFTALQQLFLFIRLLIKINCQFPKRKIETIKTHERFFVMITIHLPGLSKSFKNNLQSRYSFEFISVRKKIFDLHLQSDEGNKNSSPSQVCL